MIQFSRTKYLLGAADARQFPDDAGGEVAFAGRSNAGKSSVINAVCQRKNLARTGKTPGTTRLFHFFETLEDRRLTDLPGYGFARVSRAEQQRWERMLADYLGRRRSLRGLIIAMDIRRPLTELDRRLIEWCDARILLLLTKRDKLSRGATAAARKKTLDAAPRAEAVLAFSKYEAADADAVRRIIAQWWAEA